MQITNATSSLAVVPPLHAATPTYFPQLKGAFITRGKKLGPVTQSDLTPSPNKYQIPSMFSPNKIVSTGRTLTFHGGGPRPFAFGGMSPKELRPGPGSYEVAATFGKDGKFVSVTKRKRVTFFGCEKCRFKNPKVYGESANSSRAGTG